MCVYIAFVITLKLWSWRDMQLKPSHKLRIILNICIVYCNINAM